MTVTYSIRDWADHFEVSQTRKVETVRWVPVPVKHDGLRFRRLMAMSHGLEVFGAWVLILQVAGKCKQRGVLATDSGEPMTAADLAAMTGASEKQMRLALQVLASKEISWVVETKSNRMDSESNELSLQERTVQDSTGEERTGDSPEPQAASVPPVLTFPTVGESAEWVLTHGHVASLRESFPTLSIEGECRKALGWLKANSRRRKTPKGMPQFLFGWMSRAQNGRGPTGSVNHVLDAASQYLGDANG